MPPRLCLLDAQSALQQQSARARYPKDDLLCTADQACNPDFPNNSGEPAHLASLDSLTHARGCNTIHCNAPLPFPSRQMKITLLSDSAIQPALDKLIGHSKEIYFCVAWGTQNPLVKPLLEAGKAGKITRIIVGTDFYQTDPDFLRALQTFPNARVMLGTSAGTFHPKVYLFISGETAAALVGSANFTGGAMTKNAEAAVLVEGCLSDALFKDLLQYVGGEWKRGSPITSEFLDSYALQYKALDKQRKALAKPVRRLSPKKGASHSRLLAYSWDEFILEVRKEPKREVPARLAMLGSIRKLFSEQNSFGKLSPVSRKAIAGTIGSSEAKQTELAVNQWKWFGSMVGAGGFKRLVNTNDSELCAAVDTIPAFGPISEETFDEFAERMRHAYNRIGQNPGLATSTRLLAVKRPDYFVCIDSKNKSGICKDLGLTASSLHLADYWRAVVEVIMLSTWWNAARPTGPDGPAWDARTALLDAIYYAD